jgi:pimeloyl-ACP methyl ester carboxylesterase
VPWLLLRGLVREHRHYGDFPERLSLALGGDRVIGLDLPGVGTARDRAPGLSIDAYVDDLRSRWLVESQGAPNWHIFCVSLGGMVGLRWMARYPRDFAGGVVVNTSAKNLGPLWHRMQPGVWGDVLTSTFTSDLAARERRILGFTTNTRGNDESVIAAWAEIARTAPVKRSTLLRQLIAAARFRAPAKLETPALILAGAGDRLAHPNMSRTLAARLGASLAVHPTAGHDLALDVPEWVVAQISDWLGATPSETAASFR